MVVVILGYIKNSISRCSKSLPFTLANSRLGLGTGDGE